MRHQVAFFLCGVAFAACSSSTGGTGGGGPESFDPCSSNPSPGFDPDARGLAKCCTDGVYQGPAHCVPGDVVPAAVASGLAMCPAGGLCLPDKAIRAGASYQPATCTALAMSPGGCLSLCIPRIANDPQVGLLPQDVCADDEVCVPCVNPLSMVSTGACQLLDPMCGGDGGAAEDAGPAMCPYSGPPIIDPATLSDCAPVCGGAHCVPANLVSAAQQPLLASCMAGTQPGLCAPDELIESGGNYLPPPCRSVAGAEGRCISTCLPSVAAQAAQLPQDSCAAGQKCAPCFNPVGADPTAATGACTIACDAPKEPPLQISCPWTGPPLVDPTTFAACSPTCGGAHCVPTANVPVAQQALLAPCAGGYCTPDAFITTGGKLLAKSCT